MLLAWAGSAARRARAETRKMDSFFILSIIPMEIMN
jgi:hypothetical protein